MNLRHMVAFIASRDGAATVASLLSELSVDGYTEKQIRNAVCDARRNGLIAPKGKSLPGKPCTYRPAQSAMSQLAGTLTRHSPSATLIASVWDMANPKTTWPQPPAVRTIHAPLGPWNSEEA